MTAPKAGSARDQVTALALGRMFRLMSRPFQQGDIEQYEKCRSIILNLHDTPADHRSCYARDRLKGAAGD